MTKTRLQRGFTLIETMIALLIFSVGLMGMASLMVVSVKTNQSAYLRTQASFLAQSMADRMRANMGQINAYNGSYNYSTSIGIDPCASGAACSPANQVARDRLLWSRLTVDSLPNPVSVINCNGAARGGTAQAGSAPYDGLCTMTISWDETTLRRGQQSANPADATADLQTFAWVFQP